MILLFLRDMLDPQGSSKPPTCILYRLWHLYDEVEMCQGLLRGKREDTWAVAPRSCYPHTLALQLHLFQELSNTSFNLVLLNIHLFQTAQELPLNVDMLMYHILNQGQPKC